MQLSQGCCLIYLPILPPGRLAIMGQWRGSLTQLMLSVKAKAGYAVGSTPIKEAAFVLQTNCLPHLTS